jgi:hypothetical protein
MTTTKNVLPLHKVWGSRKGRMCCSRSLILYSTFGSFSNGTIGEEKRTAFLHQPFFAYLFVSNGIGTKRGLMDQLKVFFLRFWGDVKGSKFYN